MGTKLLSEGKNKYMATSIVADIIKGFVNLIVKASEWFFAYPVNINYVGQFETEKGYVFVIEVYTEENRVIQIPKKSFSIKIIVDSKLAHRMKEKRVYGEHIDIFDSEVLLKTYLSDRTYGNVLNYVACHKQCQRLFLLTRVKGPNSENPSLRFQLGKFYQKVKIKVIVKHLTPIILV
ncbi:MAG: hypothetical protein WCE90_06235 [Candidatus Zixiibacteriota bacterium]